MSPEGRSQAGGGGSGACRLPASRYALAGQRGGSRSGTATVLRPERGALRSLERAMELGEVSARGADKIVRVEWSLADLAARSRPEADDMQIAINWWLGVSQ